MKRVASIDAGYESYEAEEEALAGVGATFEVFAGDKADRAGKIAFAEGAVGLFVRLTDVDTEFLDALPTLEAIVRYGVGYDSIDIPAATERGIKVCIVQGYANESVSDHALAMILACVRGLRPGLKDMQSKFCAPPRDPMPDLRDMTLGIVGLGRIGGTLCTKAPGLFKRVLACDPYIPEERFATLGATPCDLDTLLAESDAISLHCNLTDETRRMFDREALAKMRPTAILVNTARGPVVDEQALLEALDGGRLYGAGLDVWCDEPPGANQQALIDHPHVFPSRHCAWFSTEANNKLQRGAARNMAAMLRGEIPDDCLNADAFR